MRKVLQAHFHEAIHVQGFGELGRSLPAQGKALNGLSMTHTPEGIEVSAVPAHAKAPVFFLVPWPNVKIAHLAPPPEEPKAPTEAK